MISQTAEFADLGLHSILLTATPPFLAALTLALHTLKKPHKRMGRSDGELIKTAAEYAADHFRQVGQHEEFIQGILQLPERMDQLLSGEVTSGEHRRGISSLSSQDLQATNHNDDSISSNFLYGPGIGSVSFELNNHIQDPFEDMTLDEFWAIMEGDFTEIGDSQHDIF